MLDFQPLAAIAFLLLAAAGLVYAIFATYLYFRFERSSGEKYVPVAIAALIAYYVLLSGFSYVQDYVLLPTLLLFLMAETLIMAIWFGSRARSKAGRRAAWAAALTLAAFICRIGNAIAIHRWS